MPLIAFILALIVIALLGLSVPILLFLRYRVGTMRRRGRIGMAALNLISFLISSALFLWFAAISTFWIPRAFSFSVGGLGAGLVLGCLGLWLTRWEKTSAGLFYTPNRWLVLLVTLSVTARLVYGLWRIWHAWQQAGPESSWMAAAGVAGSMSVGAVVLGYYTAYAAGLCWQLRRSR